MIFIYIMRRKGNVWHKLKTKAGKNEGDTGGVGKGNQGPLALGVGARGGGSAGMSGVVGLAERPPP